MNTDYRISSRAYGVAFKSESKKQGLAEEAKTVAAIVKRVKRVLFGNVDYAACVNRAEANAFCIVRRLDV